MISVINYKDITFVRMLSVSSLSELKTFIKSLWSQCGYISTVKYYVLCWYIFKIILHFPTQNISLNINKQIVPIH